MGWIKAIFINVLTFLAVAPFVTFFVVWAISYLVYKSKKKATEMAMDITVFFLIAAVSAMFNEVFNTGVGFWLILLLLLLATGLLGNVQNRVKGRLDFAKLYRVIWRMGFLFLALVYVLLLLIGIIKGLF